MSATLAEVSPRTAITTAVNTLLKTIGEMELQCNPSDFGYFDSTLQALETFQQSMISVAAGVVRRRNLLLPIHSLPAEIFLRILQLAVEFHDDGWHDGPLALQKMAQVSVHWRNVIRASPSFWRVIRDDMDARLQATVLRLNPNGPLVVWTKVSQGDVADEFLKRLLPLAHRWRILIAQRPSSNAFLAHLQHLPPTLKDLIICLDSHTSLATLPLAEGQPLRHVDLTHISVPWDSSRLRNLQTLSLRNLRANQPTIHQIVSMLSSSPNIWRIVFENWDSSMDYTGDLRRYADTIIPLPSLTTLILDEIPTNIVYFLISHIQTTTLSCLMTVMNDANDATVDILYPTSTIFDLVEQPLSQPCIKASRIFYDNRFGEMDVMSDPRPRRTQGFVYWVEDEPGLGIAIPVKRSDSAWHRLAEILATHAPCLSLDIIDSEDSISPDLEPEAMWAPHWFPLPLLHHLPNLEHTMFMIGFNAAPLLRYLGSPRRDVNEGATWLCPKLSVVILQPPVYNDDVDLAVQGVLDFVWQRYLGQRAEDNQNGDGRHASEGGNMSNDGDPRGGDELEMHGSSSSTNTDKYPVMLKELILPAEVLSHLRQIEDMRYLERLGILVLYPGI